MKKIKAKIINVNYSEMTNKETGEIISLTKVNYTHPRENTENFIGPAVLECYRVGNHVNKLKDKTIDKIDRPVELELEEQFTKNGVKFVLVSVDGQALK